MLRGAITETGPIIFDYEHQVNGTLALGASYNPATPISVNNMGPQDYIDFTNVKYTGSITENTVGSTDQIIENGSLVATVEFSHDSDVPAGSALKIAATYDECFNDIEPNHGGSHLGADSQPDTVLVADGGVRVQNH